MKKRNINRLMDRWFGWFGLGVTLIGLVVLAALLVDIFSDGLTRIDWSFITSYPSRRPMRAGILSALVGTIWVVVLTGAIAIPMGVMSAIYLEEYAKKNWLTNLIEINISNLAGVPSIIYGLLGLGLFVNVLGFGRSILAGSATLSLLILPIVIMTTREALRTVPSSIREASYALGASRWQTISKQVLPAALPGTLTGVILALSRAIGETAPLIVVGALTYVAFLPESPIVADFPFINLSGFGDPFSVLPIQIFNWVSRPQKGFLINAAAAIIVLLAITFIMNGIAVWLRHRYGKKARW